MEKCVRRSFDGRLDLDQSVRRINQRYPDFPEQKIKEFLIPTGFKRSMYRRATPRLR
jgi:hypothetical protein